MGPSERRIRVARGVAASSVATLVALGGHVVAGGTVPSPLLVAIPLVLSWLPGVALIGRRPSLWRQAAVIVPAQAALHAVFAASATSARAMADPDAMPGMHGMVATPLGGGTVHQSGAMWAGHALAALLTVLAWQRGEGAVRTLLRVAREALRVLLIPSIAAVPALPRPVRPLGSAPLLLRERLAVRSRPRRGPPAGLRPA